ncbi:MAG: L,D-transpeptidase [Hyphomicrobiaceae bacterium]
MGLAAVLAVACLLLAGCAAPRGPYAANGEVLLYPDDAYRVPFTRGDGAYDDEGGSYYGRGGGSYGRDGGSTYGRTGGGDERYLAFRDGGFVVPGVKSRYLTGDKVRHRVNAPPGYRPGTIVVDPGARALFLIEPGGSAIRYAIGVGREGFGWSGRAVVGRKEVWPKWTPPAEMVARDPRVRPFRNGMLGGPDNPLGARALYLFQDGADTLYRLHGTAEPWSVGRRVSSGCIRLFNQDIIDLFDRVPVGTEVVVLPDRQVAG